MRSIIAILCLSSMIAGCTVEPAFDTVPPTNSPDVKLSHEAGLGSATHIGRGYLISAAHVVGGRKSMKVRFADGQVTTAIALWSSKENDIALLRYEDHGQATQANLACRDPQDGEPIRAVGNPNGLENVALRGFVAGPPRQLGPWLLVAPTDMTLLPGMSGGGVYDEAGSMIGVSVGTMLWGVGGDEKTPPVPTWGRIGYVVGARTICDLLAREV